MEYAFWYSFYQLKLIIIFVINFTFIYGALKCWKKKTCCNLSSNQWLDGIKLDQEQRETSKKEIENIILIKVQN